MIRPTKTTSGAARVDAVALERVRAGVGAVLVGVDPVVDHVDPVAGAIAG